METLRHLPVLHEAVRSIQAATQPPEVINGVLNALNRLGFHAVTVWCVERKPLGDVLVNRPSLSSPNRDETPIELPMIRSSSRRVDVLLDGKSAIERNGLFPVVSSAHVGGELFLVPILTRHQKIGLLEIHLRRLPPEFAVLSEFVDVLASIAGMAVENLSARESLQLAARRSIDRTRLQEFEASNAIFTHQTLRRLRDLRTIVLSEAQKEPELQSNPRTRKLLSSISEGIQACESLLEEPIEKFRADTKVSHNSVTKLIAETVGLWGPRASLRGCKIIIPEQDDRTVFAPASHVREILSCLIVNAIEASARHIEISVRDGPGTKLSLFVADDGAGIDADVQMRIFSFGFSTKGVKGSGMGMVIVDMLLRALGGRIALLSGGKAIGDPRTIFELEFPTKQANNTRPLGDR